MYPVDIGEMERPWPSVQKQLDLGEGTSQCPPHHTPLHPQGDTGQQVNQAMPGACQGCQLKLVIMTTRVCPARALGLQLLRGPSPIPCIPVICTSCKGTMPPLPQGLGTGCSLHPALSFCRRPQSSLAYLSRPLQVPTTGAHAHTRIHTCALMSVCTRPAFLLGLTL